jgi:hypothetical protein
MDFISHLILLLLCCILISGFTPIFEFFITAFEGIFIIFEGLIIIFVFTIAFKGIFIVFEGFYIIFEDLAIQFSSYGMISLMPLLDIAKFQSSSIY